jgi:hypothetical protein
VFERFTERARQSVVYAQEEARALGHNYIGTEHLLLGLLRVEDGLAARVLASLNIVLEDVRAQVARIIGAGEEVALGQIPFTPRAKRVLELSLRKALEIGHTYIGTEHILLGLAAEGEGVASRILLDFDVTSERIYEEVSTAIGLRGGVPHTPRGFRPRRFPSPRRAVVEMHPAPPWEYRVEQLPDDDVGSWLNSLGAEGWELTTVVGTQFIFKRPCPPARERRSA